MKVTTPSGRTVQLTEAKPGKFAFTDTSELGIYEVSADGQNAQLFAVNLFNAGESDIRTRSDIQIDRVPVPGDASPEASRRELWKALLLSGLAVLLLEWYIYGRRVSM